MAGKRKAYAPFSTSAEAGVSAAPVEGFIEVDQDVRPTVSTGFIDQTGIWQGNLTSDSEFIAYQKDEGIANGGDFITPSANADGTWPLDMTGYSDILVAIKPTNGGNYAITAVMGPADVSFANLNPVDAAATLRGNIQGLNVMNAVLLDSAEACTADVWNIFMVKEVLANQKLLQFKITNNSGSESTIQTAFMRFV